MKRQNKCLENVGKWQIFLEKIDFFFSMTGDAGIYKN